MVIIMQNIRNINFYFILVVLATNIIAFSGGIVATWATPVLHRLETVNEDNPFGTALTSLERSLINAMAFLGTSAGPLFGGIFVDKLGRKSTLLYCSGVLQTTALIIIVFSKSLILFYVARFICGFASGNSLTCIPIYYAEISEVRVRGIVLSSFNFSIFLGHFFSYCVGPYVSIRTFNITCSMVPPIFLLAFIWCPESPYYLVSKGDFQAAQNVLSKLRKTSRENVIEELQMVKETVEEQMKTKSSIVNVFVKRENRKSIFLGLGLFTCMQFSGISAIIVYTTDIFRASGSSIDSDLSTITIGGLQVLASLIIPIFVEKYGRKMLLLQSAIGMFVSLIPLGIYFHFKDISYNVDDFRWVPLTFLIIFVISYALFRPTNICILLFKFL